MLQKDQYVQEQKKRLKQLFKIYKIDVKKLTTATGISRMQCSRYVNGTSFPSLYNFYRIVSVFSYIPVMHLLLIKYNCSPVLQENDLPNG